MSRRAWAALLLLPLPAAAEDFKNLRIRDLPDKYFNKNYMKSLD